MKGGSTKRATTGRALADGPRRTRAKRAAGHGAVETRRTRQRGAIERLFAETARPLSPVEVLAGSRREVPGINLATVYRTIRKLEGEGVLQAVALPGVSPRYELVPRCEACEAGHGRGVRGSHGAREARGAEAHDHHHHHFHCEACDRVFDLEGCPGRLEALAPPGFVVRSHDITLFGRCGACAKGAKSVAEMARGRRGS